MPGCCQSGYLQISSLQNYITHVEKNEIALIKKANLFPRDKFPKKPKFSSVVHEAEKYIREKVEMWEPITQQDTTFLDILAELTRIVQKKHKKRAYR